ncbi:MAG: type II toxin-antitoxin system VapC family toxin [Dehalococcoidia bacterium]
MNIVIDTSVVIAVITNEKHKPQLVRMTEGMDLIAPSSLHWEIGNALSAMLKRQRLTLEQAKMAVSAYKQIPLRLSDVELDMTIDLAEKLDIYAYDAYVIACALKHRCSLLTLDNSLAEAARKIGVRVREEVS